MMLKDYLERVDLENSEELKKLQSQMQNLLDELNANQELIDRLSREKNLDVNIFSPRNIDTEADEKIEKARKEKLDLNQRIEYVRGLIETYTQKKIEYEELQKELLEVQPDNQPVDLENLPVNRSELLDFLNAIYRQTELCLAITSNHNRCKTELRSLRSTIKKYAAKIENKE